ncbi:hypothetical protein Tco_1288303, partial [Tanacetum coccineum]
VKCTRGPKLVICDGRLRSIPCGFMSYVGHGGGRAVLDFESSDVLMPSMNGGNQPMNLSSGSANTYNDRCQQTEVDNMLCQQCQIFASKKRRRNVNAQRPINVDSQGRSSGNDLSFIIFLPFTQGHSSQQNATFRCPIAVIYNGRANIEKRDFGMGNVLRDILKIIKFVTINVVKEEKSLWKMNVSLPNISNSSSETVIF